MWQRFKRLGTGIKLLIATLFAPAAFVICLFAASYDGRSRIERWLGGQRQPAAEQRPATEPRRPIGELVPIDEINPSLLEGGKDTSFSLPSYLTVRDLAATTTLWAAVGAQVVGIGETPKLLLLTVMLIVSGGMQIGLITAGARHIITYNRWLRIYGDDVRKTLAEFKDLNRDHRRVINTLLSKGETRDLLLLYPDVYRTLEVPHLWNGLFATKFQVLAALFTLTTAVLVLLRLWLVH